MDQLIAEMFAVLDRIKAKHPHWPLLQVNLAVTESSIGRRSSFTMWNDDEMHTIGFDTLEQLEAWTPEVEKQSRIAKLKSELAALEEKR